MDTRPFDNVLRFETRTLTARDRRGRKLVIRPLLAEQRQKLIRLLGKTAKNRSFTSVAELICTVRAVDEQAFEIPVDRVEFDRLAEIVDEEGIEAAMLALERAGLLVDELAKWFVNWKPSAFPHGCGGDAA